ncbi:hypothetical protein D3C86_1782700 [compost metagenome]
MVCLLLKLYSPPAKLKRSEVTPPRPVIDISSMLASLRGLLPRNCPPYRVKPSISWEVTWPPRKVCGRARPSSERRIGSTGIHSPTFSSVFASRAFNATPSRPKSSAGRPSSCTGSNWVLAVPRPPSSLSAYSPSTSTPKPTVPWVKPDLASRIKL